MRRAFAATAKNFITDDFDFSIAAGPKLVAGCMNQVSASAAMQARVRVRLGLGEG